MSITSAIQGEGNGHMLKEDEFSRVLFECVTVCVVRMNVCVCVRVCVCVCVCVFYWNSVHLYVLCVPLTARDDRSQGTSSYFASPNVARRRPTPSHPHPPRQVSRHVWVSDLHRMDDAIPVPLLPHGSENWGQFHVFFFGGLHSEIALTS
jgi:hypothetical protein